MTRFRFLSDLPPGMRRALVKCDTLVVEVADERHCGIAPRTLAALLRHELVEATTDRRLRKVYRPTALGAAILSGEDRPLYLRARRVRGPGASSGFVASRDEMLERAEWGTERDPGPGARGYTTSPARAMKEGGVPVEAVPLAVLEEFAADAAERRRGEPGRRREELDRRIRNLAFRARAAAKAGDDEALAAIHSELDGLERRVVEMERARQNRAA